MNRRNDRFGFSVGRVGITSNASRLSMALDDTLSEQ